MLNKTHRAPPRYKISDFFSSLLVSDNVEYVWRITYCRIDFLPGGFMDLLAAIKREERKLENELGKLQHKLNGVRAAAKALGGSAIREVTQVKKHVMSAAARAKIGKATKARWARFRAGKNKKK
jgi:hypothetical protein